MSTGILCIFLSIVLCYMVMKCNKMKIKIICRLSGLRRFTFEHSLSTIQDKMTWFLVNKPAWASGVGTFYRLLAKTITTGGRLVKKESHSMEQLDWSHPQNFKNGEVYSYVDPLPSLLSPVHTSCKCNCKCDTDFDVTSGFCCECFAGVEHISTNAKYSMRICYVKIC